MANEKRTDPRKNFVPRLLPWLLAAAALGVFLWTLNHWVSLLNLGTVAILSGWAWQPEVYNPVFAAATAAIHLLPAAKIPLALNLFSALCGALTIGLLARSVAILPHDRTDAQREREPGGFSFLTMGSAWLPPLLAATICGLQMTFWEYATNGSSEMFDLLLFAIVVWSLLEYRLDERRERLYLAALVYGAGMAENWAMIGFLPIFVGSLIWIRGLQFFRLRFLKGMMVGGLIGMLFYFLLPLVAVISHKTSLTFWQALKANLAAQWDVIKMFFIASEIRRNVLLLSLGSLVPVLLIGFRWRSGFGDSSKLGLALTSFMFHVIHAIMLFLCVWVAFDSPFSPRHLGFGLPFLTFYYLGALAAGYYSGYFLLVFGKEPSGRSRHGLPREGPDTAQIVQAGSGCRGLAVLRVGNHRPGLQKYPANPRGQRQQRLSIYTPGGKKPAVGRRNSVKRRPTQQPAH